MAQSIKICTLILMLLQALQVTGKSLMWFLHFCILGLPWRKGITCHQLAREAENNNSNGRILNKRNLGNSHCFSRAELSFMSLEKRVIVNGNSTGGKHAWSLGAHLSWCLRFCIICYPVRRIKIYEQHRDEASEYHAVWIRWLYVKTMTWAKYLK